MSVSSNQVARLWYELNVDDHGESVPQKMRLAPRPGYVSIKI